MLDKYIKIIPIRSILIFLLPIIAFVYYGLTLPVTFDEAYTYNFFVKKPIYYCMIHYPLPNNHILHSVILNFTDLIPVGSNLLKIRFPVILITSITIIISYYFMIKYYGEKVATTVCGLFPVFFMSILFGFQSRGYYLIVLFFIICMFCTLDIIIRNRRKSWILFSVCSILGFYTMPSFLYPFITLNVIMLMLNIKHIRTEILYNVIIGVIVGLLYAPIIIFDGIGALINNPFVKPVSRFRVLQELPEFFLKMTEEITGFSFWIVGLILLIAFILAIKEKNKTRRIVFVVFLLAPFVLLLIHSVIPFYRTFIYYGFIFMFLIGVGFAKFINKLPNAILYVSVVLIQVVCILNFNSNIKNFFSYNYTIGKINEKIIKEDKSYYFLSWRASELFLFETYEKDFEVGPVLYENAYEQKASADTISYDFVIIDKQADETIHRQPFLSDNYINIYKK